MHNRLLPFWDKVIFVDWNGVMSNEKFWNSILTNPSHPLYEEMNIINKEIFNGKQNKLTDWMKGKVNTEEIIEEFDISKKDKRFKDYKLFLKDKLRKDLYKMSLSSALISILKKFHNDAFIVLATDNMDCFYNLFFEKTKYPMYSNSREQGDPLFPHAKYVFDDIICSSQIGTLKAEEPELFFGSWLISNNIKFNNSFLIDDSAKNCKAFRNSGGIAYQMKDLSDSSLKELTDNLFKWTKN